MFNKVMFKSTHDNWSTPKNVYDELDKEFHFDCDPCPLGGADGLEKEFGRVSFCNPPYSKLKEWIKKCYEESIKGKTVVMLIPSRTDTIAFHDYVLKYAKEIRFVRGRLKFGGAKNSAPFPSAIVVFRP
jgi:site-specific DNA-methyltransferase (adenine-specific)